MENGFEEKNWKEIGCCGDSSDSTFMAVEEVSWTAE